MKDKKINKINLKIKINILYMFKENFKLFAYLKIF